ncbi:MAG TPA: hypothetical protein PLE19_03570 [Planctomycetota bacterium]|nr:hypothetical protein [Planctomycetota bacterium]HRR78623.1 hypothetical protein [Planctomycetota bacterium]HRT95894.1 hypothetical protein [Planctomycetota bacterium]
MSDERDFQVRQDILDAEYGSGGVGMGPTGGQVAFDLFFGILAPVALLLADPALFVPSVADRAALPPYLAMPTYVAEGALIAALAFWGLSGMRRSALGMLLAGPFAVGALLSAALGLVLLPFALVHCDLLSGLLAFTPWLTAFVFARHCALACRVGAHRSLALTVVLLAVTFTALTAVLVSVGTARHRRALVIESLLLSESPADFEYGCQMIRDRAQIDMDRLATVYFELKEDDPRRPRLAAAHLRFTGASIEQAVQRLFPRVRQAPPPDAEVSRKEEDPQARLIDLLFSAERVEHLKAADDLLSHDPDPKMLEAIVQRYRGLPEGDPRREWIESAYTSLNADGETIQQALKRFPPKPTPRKSAAEPSGRPDALPPGPTDAPQIAP